jgi:hypothetical protein
VGYQVYFYRTSILFFTKVLKQKKLATKSEFLYFMK